MRLDTWQGFDMILEQVLEVNPVILAGGFDYEELGECLMAQGTWAIKLCSYGASQAVARPFQGR